VDFCSGETSKPTSIAVNGDHNKETDDFFYLDLLDNSANSLFE
jgi:hypothetical protein